MPPQYNQLLHAFAICSSVITLSWMFVIALHPRAGGLREDGDIGKGGARRLEWDRSSVQSRSAVHLRKLLKSSEDILNDRDHVGETGERQ